MDKVAFEIVSPEKLLASKDVEMVVVPGELGDFGVLPRHSPLISTVRPGVISIYENRQVVEQIFVSGGFAEVTPVRCTVLADEAMPLSEIDVAAAERTAQDAREDIRDAGDDAGRRAVAERRLAVAQAKIDAVKRSSAH